jgi:outer membrane protein assembly factor BamB
MKTRHPFLLGAALLALALPALAADWPQWRGPRRDDVSRETDLLKTWPREGPRLLWTFDDAGIGYSGPAIVGNRLYTLGGDGKKAFVFALDLTTREKAWSTEVGPFFSHGNGDGPRSTPTVDGDALYCLTGHGDLLRVATKDGKIAWKINLRKDLGGQMASGWGYSESVLVDGDRVICTPGGAKGALAALDKSNGKVVWRSKDYKAPATYSSIVIAHIGGVKQYVQVTGQGVAGIAADNGDLLWQSNQSAHGISVSTPVCKGDLVYVSTGYGVGGGAVRVTKEGNRFKAEKLYDPDMQKIMANHHGGFVLVGDHVYGYSDNRGGWICQDLKTGKLVWRGKGRDIGKGSLTCAGGCLYLYTESGGRVALVDADPAGWNQKGRFAIPKRSKRNRHQMAWTHPVVANGRLYLRDQEYLFCYDVSAGSTGSR